MASPRPDSTMERSLLEARLASDLLRQSHHHKWQTGSLEQLQELEARIQATAQQLEPHSPQSAILAARRRLALDDLAHQIARRAELPDDPLLVPDHLRTRTQHLESRILDAARELEPMEPQEVIARVTPLAHEHLSRQMELMLPDPADRLEAARRRLQRVSRRLEGLAAGPRPSQHQRIRQTSMALARLDRLEAQARHFAESHAALPHRGNTYEISASLQALESPRPHADRSLEHVFRHPARARQRLAASYQRDGESATLQHLAEDPAVFGRLRGWKIPLVGQTQDRGQALEAASGHAQRALEIHHQRSQLTGALDSARSYRKLQAQNRQLVQALPRRESLLSDLGRHMAGLELHEVEPLLCPGQGKLVEDLRQAELQFLEPLREASGKFLALQTGGVSQPEVHAKAQRIAALFQYAPRHILRRLTPPQMQGTLVAVAIARRVLKAVTRKVAV
ncbi:MAG: hypothetical protein GY719_37720 [bacterium]|nr:hypothetical protein [bacterium]